MSGLLAAIADEVQTRTAAVLAGLSVEFAARIAHARKTLPKEQAAAAVAALKQARQVAVKAVRENAASEIKGRQKAVQVMRRRRQMQTVSTLEMQLLPRYVHKIGFIMVLKCLQINS